MGEDVKKPAIRFAGFTDAWEQRMLKGVASVRTGFPFDSNVFSDTGAYLVITNGNIQDDNPTVDNNVGNRIDMADERIKEQYVLDIGDILVTMDGTVGRTAKVAHSQLILAQRVGRLTAKENFEFLYQALNTGDFLDAMTTLSHGGTIKHISLAEISGYTLLVPIDKKEQIKIGDLFHNLDDLITLHQRKYDKLVNLKKSMLEKMFPQHGADTPEIRFAGFTDAWEQRKLGELCNIATGKLDANAMIENGKYDFYTSGIKKYRIDVAEFAGPAITIAGNGATVGYMHLADGLFNAYQRTYVLTGFCADRQFLFSSIGNVLPKKIKEEARASNIPYIVLDMLTDLKIQLPPTQLEQSQIGDFFHKLDDLITLHQRKLEKLQNIKKSCLEKMFV
ncbi:restriction endonuclease subunit S [Akkermansia sp.]|uniref:restriction endonuclease subunit S n=1 Tax=Akkermansia sp. TaxID=1872421 RepID=UPI0025C167DB|nr:restriction endonuclease subunit S [Akkermansia sp.]MCC8149693.1 restriction endonuclease subunit S [Akkermansia sp.]